MTLRKLINHCITPQGATGVVIILLWGYQLMIFLRAPFLQITILKGIVLMSIPLGILFFSLIGIPYWGKKIHYSDCLFLMTIVFVYFLNFVIYPQNTAGLEEYAFTFLITVLPFYLVGLLIDINKLYKWFYYLSIIIILATVFYDLFFIKATTYSGTAEAESYYMSRSYTLLVHVILVLWATFRKPSLLNLSVLLLGVFMIFSYGTRGPIICIISFIISYIFFVWRLKKIGVIIFIVTLGVLVFLRYDILTIMHSFSTKLGMSTRVFEYIQEGMFIGLASSSGRDEIAINLLDKIWQNNGIGFGIRGIREGYAHNIFIDFWFEYGLFVGSLLLLLLLVTIIKGYKNCRSELEKGFLLLLFSRGFMQLLISNTYLNAPYLFILLGYCIRIYRRAKSNTIQVE